MNDRIQAIYRHEMGLMPSNMPAPGFGWWLEKETRSFVVEEIPFGVWVKIGENGQTFLLYLHKNGDVTEKPLFNDGEWSGSWKLVEGALRIKIDNYESEVVASKEGPIHLAMQFENNYPRAFFKFIRVKD
jgi:hypothetical protein